MLLILITAISISSVSADDSNSTDVIAIDESQIDLEINEEDALSDASSGVREASSISVSSTPDHVYGETGLMAVKVTGGTIRAYDIAVAQHPEAIISYVNDTIGISGLTPGRYTLNLAVTPDENHTASVTYINFTVSKPSATIKASQLTAAYKKSTNWSIKVFDGNGNPLGNVKVVLKIYTGNKYVTAYVNTNNNGIATYNTKSLAAGTHKVELGISNENYTSNEVSSSIKVVKQTDLKYKVVQRTNGNKGALLSYLVVNKKTGKGINGIKVKVQIYTGKTYKTYTLKTKKLKSGKKTYNGALGFSTNNFKVGKHTVKIVPVDFKYNGSVKTYIKITKSAVKRVKFFRSL